jgi:hypothetical protein
MPPPPPPHPQRGLHLKYILLTYLSQFCPIWFAQSSPFSPVQVGQKGGPIIHIETSILGSFQSFYFASEPCANQIGLLQKQKQKQTRPQKELGRHLSLGKVR